MSFLSSIGNFFKTILSGFAKRNSNKLLDFALGQAVGFVTVLMDSDLSGAQKKALVKKQLVASLATQGAEVAESELNLLVELAVDKIKSQKG